MKNLFSKNNSLKLSILVNVIISIIFVTFIFSASNLIKINIKIQDAGFASRFNSRLLLKSISDLSLAKAEYQKYICSKNIHDLEAADDLILSGKSDYSILMSEYASQEKIDFIDRTKSFDEFINTNSSLIELNKFSHVQMNSLVMKLDELIKTLYFEESRTWQDEAQRYFNLSYFKTKENESLIWTIAIFAFFQLALIVFTYMRHKLLQRLDAQNEQLVIQARMSTLGVMSAELAHELNSPLMVIDGRMKQVINELKENEFDKERILKNIETVNRNSQRIQNIVKNFKLLSKNGKLDSYEEVYVNDLMIELNEIICKRAENLNITIHYIELNEKISIKIRKVQILQVLVNLLNNSIDAIKANAEKWIKLETLTEEGNLIILITDSGLGISKEDQKKLFAPFFTTKNTNEGTGLGLSLSKKIITDHHGDLTYVTKSKNTQFKLTLPLN